MFLRINMKTTFPTVSIFPPVHHSQEGDAEPSALQQRWPGSWQEGECCSEEWMHPQVQGKGSQSVLFSLLLPTWNSLIMVLLRLCGWDFWSSRCWCKWSLVLPFSTLPSPNTAMAALGHSQHKSEAAFISEPRIRLALCLVVMWLLTVVGVWEVL